ncbi:hypothetical protein FACS189441_7350 [Betaproteobacteria bacterium]|nr:hypothetical protein FACS189441_7350 [Betaproteobacteria bacterium]
MDMFEKDTKMSDDDDKIKLLVTLLEESVGKLNAEPNCLLGRRGMEQASVARIFYYMQNALYTDPRFIEFRYLDLDGEYSKNGKEQKIINGKSVRPDIILHRRLSNDENTMVVEFKVDGNGTDHDCRKLENFTRLEGEYKYFIGVSVLLNQQKPVYEYFRNGIKQA